MWDVPKQNTRRVDDKIIIFTANFGPINKCANVRFFRRCYRLNSVASHLDERIYYNSLLFQYYYHDVMIAIIVAAFGKHSLHTQLSRRYFKITFEC